MKKVLSCVLAIILAFSLTPNLVAFADETDPTPREQFEAIRAAIADLDEYEYVYLTWNNLTTAINDVLDSSKYKADEELEEEDIVLVKNRWETLKNSTKLDASYTPYITPTDGEYLASVDVYYSMSSKSLESRIHSMQKTAFIEVEDGKITATLRIGGFDRVQAAFVCDAEGYRRAYGNGAIRSPKLGTVGVPSDFATKYPSTYEELFNAGNFDPENNQYWRDTIVEVDSALSHGDVTFELANIAENVYVKYLSSEKTVGNSYTMGVFADFNETSLKRLPDTLDDGSFDWELDIVNAFNATSYKSTYTNEAASYSTLLSLLESDVSVEIAGGQINAGFKFKDYDSSSTQYIKEKTSGSGSVTDRYNLNGDKAEDYSEPITVAVDGSFNLTFPKDIKSLVFGKQVQVHKAGDAANKHYFAALYLRPDATKVVPLEDSTTGIKFITDTRSLSADSSLIAEAVTGGQTYELAAGNFNNQIRRWLSWDISITDKDGQAISPAFTGKLAIPVPDGWDTEQLRLYYLNRYGEYISAEGIAENGYFTVDTKITGNWVLGEKRVYDDGDSLTDGTYAVDVIMWHMRDDHPSMSNAAVIKPSKLVVKNGVHTLYLNFVPITWSSILGYMSHIWYYSDRIINQYGYPEGDLLPITVSKYYKNSDGAYAYDDVNGRIAYHPQEVYFTLSQGDNGNHPYEHYVSLQVPIMDMIAGGAPAPQDARLRIDYGGAVKVSDETPEPPAEEVIENGPVDTAALATAITAAKAVTKGNKTDLAWDDLQLAIKNAEVVLASDESVQAQIDNTVASLNAAVAAFKASLDKKQNLNKDNLADGEYAINVDMIRTNRKDKSMSSDAIDHTAKLTVSGDKYYITLDFHSLTSANLTGYLSELYYYDAGFTYDYGEPVGMRKAVEVLSYQTKADGSYITDEYNDADHPYPKQLKFPLVNKADFEGDFVPLQVFVPIMEAISEGTGTQNVLMKLDWSSLRLPGEDNTEDEEEEPISDPFKGTDAATGITVEADAGVIPNGTALRVTPVAADAPGYGVAKNVLADIGTDFALYDIKLTGSDGVTIQPQNNGAVRVSLPVPSGMDAAKIAVYRIDDGGKSLCPSGVDGGVLWFTTDHFSLFAIVERAVETTNTTHPDNKVAEPGNKDGDKGASAQKAAKKKARTVKIKFSANGGAVSVKNDGKSAKVKSVTKKLTVGKKYGSLPKATRDGLYRFKGWYTKKSGGKKVTKATIMKYKKATTLYAHWEAVYGQLNEGVYVVRLRATAGTDSSVKGYVGRQAKFRVISRTKDSNWYKVNYENKLGVKVTGYVYAGLVGTYWDDLKR